jgi:hypothetical protein
VVRGEAPLVRRNVNAAHRRGRGGAIWGPAERRPGDRSEALLVCRKVKRRAHARRVGAEWGIRGPHGAPAGVRGAAPSS